MWLPLLITLFLAYWLCGHNVWSVVIREYCNYWTANWIMKLWHMLEMCRINGLITDFFIKKVMIMPTRIQWITRTFDNLFSNRLKVLHCLITWKSTPQTFSSNWNFWNRRDFFSLGKGVSAWFWIRLYVHYLSCSWKRL